MYALYKAVEHVVQTRVQGDFVECGVWRGGSVMMMALAARHFGDTQRSIWLYDTFSGMTAPSSADIQAITGQSAQDVLNANEKNETNPFWAVASLDVVTANLHRTGYPIDRFRIVTGDILETLPTNSPRQVAIIRLDTDWYESTRHELRCLYPLLVQGGVLIVDDYGYWKGVRKAVDEFFALEATRPFLHRIDFTGRICTKI
jgi:cephalosporin hydroxylase